MPDQHSEKTPPSTVAPSDSASANPQRKSKPGKAERAAKRSVVGSQQGQPASATKAAMFASGGSAPKPQPGKFPVVFQTGAGEPARDLEFSIKPSTMSEVIGGFPDRFSFNAKYNEFKSHSEIEDPEFARDIKVSALLRLSQQVVHSHVNLGLPQGDFAPLASTDVRVPASIAAYVSQFGEHSVPALGTRFLLANYATTLKSIVWCADQIHREQKGDPIARMWLPVERGDTRSRAIIAERLSVYLTSLGVTVPTNLLREKIFSGDTPDAWDSVRLLLGNDDVTRDRFNFLFRVYETAPVLATTFSSAGPAAALRELGLEWTEPSAGHLDWAFNVKRGFTELADRWARRSATYALFFELSSSQTNRMAASGSQAQLAEVSTNDSVTVVKTHLALSAPEFSLVACFPATAEYQGGVPRRVVVTTPLSVAQRATEFVQMDWR